MNNKVILFCCLFIVCIKIIIYLLCQFGFNIAFGGGSDANYYNAFALGATDTAVNVWPQILHWLYDHNLYNRKIISTILFFISVFIIPLLFILLIQVKKVYRDTTFYFSLLWVIVYPTLYFFSNDVFRDVFMVFLFLITCLTFKKLDSIKALSTKIPLFFLLIYLSYILALFRPYLGFAIFVALLTYPLLIKIKRISTTLAIYLFLCAIAAKIGLFEPLMEYRSGFEVAGGGTTLGIQLTGTNPILFIPKFILSYLFQFFGFYLVNPSTIFVFVFESLAVIYATFFLAKNKIYFNNLVSFLIVFTFVYNTIWIIGNDNLGTAVRLRMYSYIAIIASALITYRNKSLKLNIHN